MKTWTLQVVGLIGEKGRENSDALSMCLSTEWGGASSEDCHLHNRIRLAGGFANHLHTAGPDPHTTFQLAQYPQKPGGCPFLL